ncbi:MAG: hypothetical protein H6719_30285 [Sandaracinaceae bacterium]|nr:hypothetical protein [Sandaracinaceae bacterium]
MRSPSPLLCALLLLSGCDCSAGGMLPPCSSDAQCTDAQMCVDGRCQPRVARDGSTGDDGGSVDEDGGGTGDDSGTTPTDGGGGVDASCGGENVPFDYRPPNVLLVFDRSCSMRRRLVDNEFGTGPDDPGTRWAVARDGLSGLIRRFPSRVFWGLMAFPDPTEGCGMPVDAEVPPGPGTAGAIDAELARMRIQPFGLCGLDNSDTTTQPRDTPTLDALTSAMALPEMSDPMRESFAIVVTDGGVSCGVSDAELETLTASLLAAGIPTAVVGFTTGGTVSSLEAIASRGGLVNPAGPPSYYVADDAASLDAVFDGIARRVVSCTIPLTTTPPDPGSIFVNENDTPLAMDAGDGWTYDAGTNALTLNGASCDRLRSGATTRLRISFGCAPTACEPGPEICNGFDDDCDDSVDEDCLM